MGSRRLADWLAFPMLDVAAIDRRCSAVAALVADADVRTALRAALGEVSDIERIVARVGQGSGNARDLRARRAVARGRAARAVVGRPRRTLRQTPTPDPARRWPPRSRAPSSTIRPSRRPRAA